MTNRAALKPTTKQFGSVGNLGQAAAAAVAEELGMTRDQVQQLWLGRGGEVKAGFREVLKKYGLPDNPHETERTKQAWFYPEGFVVPTLEVQAERIKRVLGIELNWPDEAQNMPFATGEFGTDGICLWPTLPTLGQLWSINDPRVRGYGEVIAATCNAINQSPDMAPLTNYCASELDQRYVRIQAEVMAKLVPLEDEAERQGFNCLVMPVNLGDWGTKLCYSSRNALWQTLHWNPKGLAIEPVAGLSQVIGTSILTAYGQQRKIFPGAQYNWGRGGEGSRSLCLGFDGGEFYLGAREAGCAGGFYGAPFALPGVSELAA